MVILGEKSLLTLLREVLEKTVFLLATLSCHCEAWNWHHFATMKKMWVEVACPVEAEWMDGKDWILAKCYF